MAAGDRHRASECHGFDRRRQAIGWTRAPSSSSSKRRRRSRARVVAASTTRRSTASRWRPASNRRGGTSQGSVTTSRPTPSERCSRRWDSASSPPTTRMSTSGRLRRFATITVRPSLAGVSAGLAADRRAAVRAGGAALCVASSRRSGHRRLLDAGGRGGGHRACRRRVRRHPSSPCAVRGASASVQVPTIPPIGDSSIRSTSTWSSFRILRIHGRRSPSSGPKRAAFADLAARSEVDYPGVWRAKQAVLEACFEAFEQRPARDPLVREFARFVAAGGDALERFARFESIAATRPGVPWQRWPAELRRPDGSDVRAFARRHARAIRFACYLQWQADRQLEAAAHAGREAGLDLGLYRDLAVGAAPDGAETWSQPGRFARGASIGAPPDPFASGGQNWNLPPPIPHSIAADGACGVSHASRGEHAACRRVADRPRDGTLAPVLDSGRRGRPRRRLRPLSVRNAPRCRRGGKHARALPCRGRRLGHRAGRPARAPRGGRHPVVPSPLVRARRPGLHRSGALSGESCGLRDDPRPADDRRVVDGGGHRGASRARPRRWRGRGRSAADPAARACAPCRSPSTASRRRQRLRSIRRGPATQPSSRRFTASSARRAPRSCCSGPRTSRAK